MNKWFDERLDTRKVRSYTKSRIDPNPVEKISRFSNSIYRKFSLTNWLIIVNAIVFVFINLLNISGMDDEKLLSIFAIQANAFFSGAYWTLLTSMFSHFSLAHLLFNLISLFFIGNFLEKITGRKKFFWFYIIAGLSAGLFYSVLSFYFGNSELGARIFISSDAYAVGASGAIFGLLGLLAVLTPRLKVYLIAGPIFALVIQSVLSGIYPEAAFIDFIDWIITIYIFISIFSIFSFNYKFRRLGIPLKMSFWVLPFVAIIPLAIVGFFVELPIGNTAHFGGLLVGLAYGIYLRKKYKRKVEMLGMMFEG